jgi:hypothetical protein
MCLNGRGSLPRSNCIPKFGGITKGRMFLVLPVKSLLACAAMGMSTYSIVLFLASLSPLEIQFLCAILNVVTAGMSVCALFHFLPQILRRLEALEKMLEIEDLDGESEGSQDSNSSHQSSFTILERTVEEKDGKLFVTTVFGADVSELKELAESPVESRETEDTTEFADLLAAATNTDEKKEN